MKKEKYSFYSTLDTSVVTENNLLLEYSKIFFIRQN